MTVVFSVAATALASVCLGTIGYLLTLLLAGLGSRPQGVRSPISPTRFTILVPAHDEAAVIGAMLKSVAALDYPAERRAVVVVADNCTDDTAGIARASGAQVIERANDRERGKGHALAFGVETLMAHPDPADAFVIIDADTWVAPDFLTVMATELARRTDPQGRAALQGRYGVLNADEGWRAALMAGAFDLVNHVKPLGRDALGLSVGLKGNGMVFTRALLREAPFSGSSITEDIDYGLDLLLRTGVTVGYVPGAVVRAQMPVSAGQAKSQRARWETGRYQLMRERVPTLLRAALRRHDPRLADAAVDLLLPPLAELAALVALWGGVLTMGRLTGQLSGDIRVWVALYGVTVAGFLAYILGGFKVSGAPRAAYAALFKAPAYAFWKLALLAAKPFDRRAKTGEWVRTDRVAMSGDEPKAP